MDRWEPKGLGTLIGIGAVTVAVLVAAVVAGAAWLLWLLIRWLFL